MEGSRATRLIRRALGLVLLVALSFAAALGAVELLLRWNVIPNEYYAQNHILGAGDGPLLFILGDSFMAPLVGPDLMDSLASALTPRRIRIRNTATAGAGPIEYLDRLRRQGPRLKPGMVLLSWYVGNDLLDVGCEGGLDYRVRLRPPLAWWKGSYTAQFARARLRVLFPDRVFFRSAAPAGSGSAGPADALLRLMAPRPLDAAVVPGRQEVDYDAMRRAGIPEEQIEAARAGRINPWIVSQGVKHPDYYRDALLVRSTCAQRAWQDAQRVLDLTLEEAARLKAPVLPVVFPHAFQVTRAHEALYRAWKLNVDEEMFSTDRPQQLLREYFRSHGVEPLDLLPAFRASGEMLYFDQDEHLNIKGQQLAARVIADELLRRSAAGTRP